MFNGKISETLECEISGCAVKLTRNHFIKGLKWITIEKDIVVKSTKFAKDLGLEDGKEKVLFEEQGWRVTVSEFRGKTYIAYIALNDKGRRML